MVELIQNGGGEKSSDAPREIKDTTTTNVEKFSNKTSGCRRLIVTLGAICTIGYLLFILPLTIDTNVQYEMHMNTKIKKQVTTINEVHDLFHFNDTLKYCVANLTKNSHHQVPFEVDPDWEGYRLGDCIKMCKMCMDFPGAKKQVGSLMDQYHKQACPENNANYVSGGNLTLISNLFEERKSDPSFKTPAEDELVIHLRLGDVIEFSKANVETMLIEGASPMMYTSAFKNSVKSAYEYIADIVNSGCKRAVIRGGTHNRQFYRKSRVYVECLEEVTVAAGHYYGYNVSFQMLEGTPEQDFYYMCHARQVVVGVGGFSRLIGRMVKYNGGKIIGRTF